MINERKKKRERKFDFKERKMRITERNTSKNEWKRMKENQSPIKQASETINEFILYEIKQQNRLLMK